MGQRQSGHKHDRKHTSYDKEQSSVISAAVSQYLCQYQTAVSYFCFFRFVKLKDWEEMLSVVASLHEKKTGGCGGGVAGNSPVKVYKQGKEPAVQEDKC